ncbi:MAG: hypothetical protein HYX39_14305 [Bacteroidetes bacterium]|nr:hypothetical protein [Bacteroidota bacterium]
MRKIYLALAVLIIGHSLSAQKLTKKEAKQLIETSLNYLKTDDSVSFVKMWYFDDTPRQATKQPFKNHAAYESYRELKRFLDTAITKNLPIVDMDIEKMDSDSGYTYKIKGWFKYDEKRAYYKGYGFLLGYYENRWAFRFYPETSISYHN